MIPEQLITTSIHPLKTSDTGHRALQIMEEYKVSHLPIVNNEQFLGLISENDIYDLNKTDEPLGNHYLSLTKPFISNEQHVFDALKLLNAEKLTLIPVLDNKQNYIGVITLQGVTQFFSEMSAVQNPGGVIILELHVNDYSLTEIAQIIESNDSKILSLWVASNNNSNELEVIIKVNKTDIAPIIQTFNRYNYTIKATFVEEAFVEDLKERFESFMNYLNI